MMEFFEFFFSGPGWVWKLLGLFFLIEAIGSIIIGTVKVTCNYRLKKWLADIDAENDNDDKDTSATADDVR